MTTSSTSKKKIFGCLGITTGFVFLIAVGLCVAAAIVGPGWYRYLYGPCAVPKVEAALDEFTPLIGKYYDAERVASSTGRIALAGPVSNLQSIQREIQAVEVPACLSQYKDHLVAANEYSIKGYLLFMQDAEDDQIESMFTMAGLRMQNANDEMDRIKICAPSCEP